MSDDPQTEIEAIAQRPVAVFAAVNGAAEPPVAGTPPDMSRLIAGVSARETLRENAGVLADAAARLAAPGSPAWAEDASTREERGESDIARLDLIYQSPDWDRAAGRRDGSRDLTGD